MSSDGNAIQGDQEAARVNYFRRDYPSSSDVTATLLDTNNDINGSGTRGMNKGKSNNGATTRYPVRQRSDNFSYKDCVFSVICLLGMVGGGWLFVWGMSVHVPFTFKVVSLEVDSMTISNNTSWDIQKYMSANLKLTLGLTNTNQELLIEPLLVSIMYDDEFLSSRKIDRVYTSSQKHKSIELDMGITASQQLSGVVVDSIAADLANNQSLVFKILIQGRYSILNCGSKNRVEYDVASSCDGVKVNFLLVESNLTTSGSMVNGPCLCKHINVA